MLIGIDYLYFLHSLGDTSAREISPSFSKRASNDQRRLWMKFNYRRIIGFERRAELKEHGGRLKEKFCLRMEWNEIESWKLKTN